MADHRELFFFFVMVHVMWADADISTMKQMGNGLLPSMDGYFYINGSTPVCYNINALVLCLNASFENHYPILDRYDFSFPEVNTDCRCNCSGHLPNSQCDYDGKKKHCLQHSLLYEGKECKCKLTIEAKGETYRAIQVGSKEPKVRLKMELKEKESQRVVWADQLLISENQEGQEAHLMFKSKPHNDKELSLNGDRSWFYHRLDSKELLQSLSINGKYERNFNKIGWFKMNTTDKSTSHQFHLFDALKNYESSWFVCAKNKTIYQWHFSGIGYRREGRITLKQNKSSPEAFVEEASVYLLQTHIQPNFELKLSQSRIKRGLDTVLKGSLTGFHSQLELEEVSYNIETADVNTETYLTVSFDSGTSGLLLGFVNTSDFVHPLNAILVQNTKDSFRFPLTFKMNNSVEVCFYSYLPNSFHSQPICHSSKFYCEEEVSMAGRGLTIGLIILGVLIVVNIAVFVWIKRSWKKGEKEQYSHVKTKEEEEMQDVPLQDIV